MSNRVIKRRSGTAISVCGACASAVLQERPSHEHCAAAKFGNKCDCHEDNHEPTDDVLGYVESWSAHPGSAELMREHWTDGRFREAYWLAIAAAVELGAKATTPARAKRKARA